MTDERVILRSILGSKTSVKSVGWERYSVMGFSPDRIESPPENASEEPSEQEVKEKKPKPSRPAKPSKPVPKRAPRKG